MSYGTNLAPILCYSINLRSIVGRGDLHICTIQVLNLIKFFFRINIINDQEGIDRVASAGGPVLAGPLFGLLACIHFKVKSNSLKKQLLNFVIVLTVHQR